MPRTLPPRPPRHHPKHAEFATSVRSRLASTECLMRLHIRSLPSTHESRSGSHHRPVFRIGRRSLRENDQNDWPFRDSARTSGRDLLAEISLTLPARAEGLEPPTVGFGIRCSAIELRPFESTVALNPALQRHSRTDLIHRELWMSHSADGGQLLLPRFLVSRMPPQLLAVLLQLQTIGPPSLLWSPVVPLT